MQTPFGAGVLKGPQIGAGPARVGPFARIRCGLIRFASAAKWSLAEVESSVLAI
jgi:hypothetical protein